MNAITSFPYPCGVREEADEMIKSLEASGSQDVALELVHHGFLLGLRVGDRGRLKQEWRLAKSEFLEHLDEVRRRSTVDERLLRPIFDGLSVAGVIYDNPDAAAVFLRKDARGTGLGGEIIEQLIARRYTVYTVDDCHVRGFYKKHGFQEIYDPESDSYQLTCTNEVKPKTRVNL